jgi:predicted PurR-regulated permease PerM
LDKFMAADGAAQIGRMAIGAVFGVILFLVLLFYFLIEGPRLAAGTLALAPPEHRPGLQSFAVQAHPILFRYITGLVVIVLFTALVVWVGVGPVFHLPHPWLLAITTGVLELLPVAGPTISACLLGGTAVNHGGTVWTFAGFAVFCFAVRIGVDQVVGPIVLGRAVRLSPIVVIFAFLAGGMLFGMLGVILAIPAMAMIKLALENYYALPVE